MALSRIFVSAVALWSAAVPLLALPAPAPSPGVSGPFQLIWFQVESCSLTSPALKCVARYGASNTTWEQKQKSSGRVSDPLTSLDPKNPVFKLTYRIYGSVATNIMVQIYSATSLMGTVSGDFNASTIPEDLIGKEFIWPVGSADVGTCKIRLWRPGKGTITNVQTGAYESTNFEVKNPIGPQRAVEVKDITGYAPMLVGVPPLPENLQGLWWLTDQGASSALISFGGPNDDGGGCNTGFILGPANEMKVRVQGERSFSTAQPAAGDVAAAAFDAAYVFNFDNAVNPEFAQIYSQSVDGIPYTGPHSIWMANFTMKFLGLGGDARYPTSKVWLRKTSFAGVNAGHDYKLVQVIDGSRQFLEPAWQSFKNYMNSAETGWTPGWMFYPSRYESPSPGGPTEVQNVQNVIRRRMVIIAVCSVLLICCVCICCAGICYAGCVKHKKQKTTPGEAGYAGYDSLTQTAVDPLAVYDTDGY